MPSGEPTLDTFGHNNGGDRQIDGLRAREPSELRTRVESLQVDGFDVATARRYGREVAVDSLAIEPRRELTSPPGALPCDLHERGTDY